MRDLAQQSKNRAAETGDPDESKDRSRASVEVIHQFGNGVSKMADRAILAASGGEKPAGCAAEWLATWARGGALTHATTKQGTHVRKWELAAYAVAYTKVREWAFPHQSSVIEAWLRRLGQEVVADFSRDLDLPSRQNNHLYWAIWGVANAAAATQDAGLWSWAGQRYFEVLRTIPADGILPLEMERGKSALGYQVYATAALVLTAELFERNGLNAYSAANNAVHRIVRRSLQGLADPAPFALLAGEKQDVAPVVSPSRLSWLEVYNARFPTPGAEEILAGLRPLGHRTYGGAITALFSR